MTPPPSEADTVSTQEDREHIGWVQSPPTLNGSPVYRRASLTSEASWNEGPEDLNTTRSSLSQEGSTLFQQSETSGNPYLDTGSSLDRVQPRVMSGRRTPELENLSSSGRSHSVATAQPIGIEFVLRRLPELLITSPRTYTFVITSPYARSARIIYDRLLWSEAVQFSGVPLALVSRVERGPRPVARHTVKIRARSFGAAIGVRNMLLSMNLGEASTYPIFYGGSIDILSVWRPRGKATHS